MNAVRGARHVRARSTAQPRARCSRSSAWRSSWSSSTSRSSTSRCRRSEHGLHFSTTGLQWVVNAYTLTFAGFLMLGGRAADLLGRRRVFLAGTALFCARLAALRARDIRGLLIGARALRASAAP